VIKTNEWSAINEIREKCIYNFGKFLKSFVNDFIIKKRLLLIINDIKKYYFDILMLNLYKNFGHLVNTFHVI